MAALACSSVMPSSEVKKWNVIIKKQLINGNAERAILTYADIQLVGFRPDNYTLPVLLKAAGSCRFGSSRVGLTLHGQAIKTGFSSHPFVQTSLMNMYRSLGSISDARKVFDEMLERDVIAWNSMLNTYACSSKMDEAQQLFSVMPSKDTTSFNIMISAYASSGRMESARALFDEMPEKDVVSWTSMISACAQAGNMEDAFGLFREMRLSSTETWNSVITGCLQSQRYQEVIDLFDEMKSGDCLPDYLTVTGVLSACAHLGSLEKGVEIHRFAILEGMEGSPHVTTALIDMYSKCGDIKHALRVFFKSPIEDIYCWNSIIYGLAIHGRPYEAMQLLSEMRNSHVNPDEITFTGLIIACSHSGLVEEGCQLFNSMQKELRMSPKLKHYGCMVDLLGRAGHLDYALELIKWMPFEPGAPAVSALLSSCITYRDIETGEKLLKLLTERGVQLRDGELMMLSNLYASRGRWEEADRWREMMNDCGNVKVAGRSEIEVEGSRVKFLAGEAGEDFISKVGLSDQTLLLC
ncbi:Pentatricopeptide repeat-containing protein At2g45350, chloroplastic [Linum perenne]